MSDAELKSLLLQLIDKVETVVSKVGQLDAKVAQIDAKVDVVIADLAEVKADVTEVKQVSSTNCFRALGRIEMMDERYEKLARKVG